MNAQDTHRQKFPHLYEQDPRDAELADLRKGLADALSVGAHLTGELEAARAELVATAERLGVVAAERDRARDNLQITIENMQARNNALMAKLTRVRELFADGAAPVHPRTVRIILDQR